MLKKMKLAPKLALVIGVFLAAIFTALICVTISMSKSAIETSTYGELNAVSKANSYQIQQIFDSAGSVAANIQDYVERTYELAAADPEQNKVPTSPEAREMCKSEIYPQTLTSLNYDVELFLRENARNTAVNNADIVGIGIMFEPYKFQKDIKNYAFYVTQEQADSDIEPFGLYEDYSKETYYKSAAEARTSVVTEPFEYNGIKMVSYAMPILHDGELQGVVMADINIDNFEKVDATNDSYPSMCAAIFDENGLTVYDSRESDNIGKTIENFIPDKSEFSDLQARMAQGAAFVKEMKRENGQKVTHFFNPIQAASETWWSLTAVETKDVNSTVTTTVLWMLLLSVMALALIILMIIFLLRKMLHPMKAVIAAAEKISEGYLDIHLEAVSQDEIGILSDTFQKMTGNLKRMVDDISYILEEVAGGNFDVRTKAEDSYVGDFETFLISIRMLNSKLSDTLSQINQGADHVATESEQVSTGAQELSQGATEQASSLEELSATINDISAQIHETAQNAMQAREQSTESGNEITSCNQEMQEMIEAMDEISHKSSEIGKIIKTIEDIAFQTNILALNAAVEAARAGAAGKGFAVVADEVRNLAGKSAEASKNTAVLIEGSVKAVEKGTKIASETAQSLIKVVQSAQSTAETIEKIAVAAREQDASIAQVTQGIEQISGVVQTNSATAQESAAVSEELSGQAQMLKELVRQFKLKEMTDRQGGQDQL